MSGERRSWPAGRSVPDEQAIDTACEECSTPWRVHQNLAGFRFACDVCNAWVDVPEPAQPTPLQIEAARSLESTTDHADQPGLDLARRPIEELPTNADGEIEIDLPSGVVYQGAIPSGAALAPGALSHVRVEEQQKWTNRTILEVGGMLFAILLPFLIAYQFFTEDEAAVLMPVSALAGGMLVILIGLGSPRYTFGGLRRARPRYFVEAIAFAALAVLCAYGWSQAISEAFEEASDMNDEFVALRASLGLGLLIGVVAVAPAIFEEIAFRGLLQGRLSALLGRFTGVFTTAIFFTLAHGVSVASPLHMGLGLYLGSLRIRSNSLLPGMLLHFLYNTSVILFMTS